MKRIPVESSSIAALGYHEEKAVLRVWFHNANVYDYYKVPVEEYENLLHAKSLGEHYNIFIKDLYDYRKIN